MRKLFLFVCAILMIGALSPMAHAQWRYRWGYWGYYPYSAPYYNWPVVVYNPLEAQQMEITHELSDLNKATNKLASYASEPTPRNMHEAREQADKVARHAHRLQELLLNNEVHKVAPSIACAEYSCELVQQTVGSIQNLVAQVNSINIDVRCCANMANTNETVNLLAEIESQARGLHNAIPK